MLTVLDREVVEGEQRVAIVDQPLDRLVVFDAPAPANIEGIAPPALPSSDWRERQEHSAIGRIDRA